MAIPTIGASTLGLYDPDNHRLGVNPNGLTQIISPLHPHDWCNDIGVSEEMNKRRKSEALTRSQKRFLAQVQGYQIGYSYTVSEVVRNHPERAVNIPGSSVWIVVMPSLEREQLREQDLSRENDWDEWDNKMNWVEENYNVVVLDGCGNVDVADNGPALLRQAHRDTGRPHSLYSMRIPGVRLKEDPWNGKALADGEVVQNHLLEAVAVIGEMYLIQQRPSIGGVSASIERTMAAVQALGGESAELLERVIMRGKKMKDTST